MTATTLVVLALAAWRLTRLAVTDTVIDRPRSRLIVWLEARWPKIAEGAQCEWCVGVWVSAAVYATWAATVNVDAQLAVHVLSAAAVAGGQGLAHGLVTR